MIKAKTAFILLLLIAADSSYGQTSVSYTYFYRVYFRDKGENRPEDYSPEDLLSPKAVSRRQKAGIAVPDFRDIPVYVNYLNEISSDGFTLHCTSKWMNTALFKTETSADITPLLDLPFVTDVKIVKSTGKKSSFNDKLSFLTDHSGLTPFDRPVTMVNGYPLHNSGFDGKGILIAILDGGFINADRISSLAGLRTRNGIKATYDFVRNNEDVYWSHNHGTAVLSVLAGKIEGEIAGTAPGADYLLLRTEDTSSEFSCEEDFWTAGAEFADSSGADIISSSLGYYNFDDPELNYKYSDLDGNTAFVTMAADIAASKGILVVNSAGNERINTWQRIICPSDGDSVVAVAAVDGLNYISSFSSAGPSSDGRVKPDNSTMGVSVPVQTEITVIGRANGTSFSCPVLSGMAACLMQAVPKALNSDIIRALRLSADRHNSPDSLYGYGIPDMMAALTELQDLYVEVPDADISVSPNPTTGDVELVFQETPQYLTIEIISMTGRLLYRQSFAEYAGRTLRLTELQNREQGTYFIKLIKETGVSIHKIIKLRN